jgi:DNA processing protein
MNTTQEDLLYEIALSKIEGIGSIMYRQLINNFGSAKNVFDASPTKLLKISNFGKNSLQNLKNNSDAFEHAKNTIEKSAQNKIRIVGFWDDDYPTQLKQFYESPPILYFKGKGKLNNAKTVAIVGTREASEYGKKVVEEIVSKLVTHNVQIISGLAYGIDVAAHKAALKNNLSTVAVLANSLETVYPALHKKVAKEIEENGLLISENPVDTKLSPSFFIARNRIIAGLSEVIIVAESAKKGGSMVTAEFANNYNKEVFAIPGAVNSKFSEGPNHLISINKAQIYTNIEDFLDWMKWKEGVEKREIKSNPILDLEKFTLDESQVLSVLSQKGEVLIDDLSWQTKIPLNKLASILLNLEFQDLVKQMPGKKFALR